MSEIKEKQETGRTPSVFASLLVMGFMISLIVASVIFFGDEVGDGPLQVSMTLATIFALSVAYYYGFRGPVISQAINSGIHGVLGTVFVLLAIGTVIGTLFLTGSVANFIYYGVTFISARFFYVTVFILCLVLSSLLGSTLTTIGAIGIPFISLASVMGVSPIIAAGAAASGGIIGNKIVRISDTANLTVDTVGGVSMDDHIRTVIRTAIPAVLITGMIFLVIGLTSDATGTALDAAQVQELISQYFHISLLNFVPILLIFALSSLRFSAFMTLMLPAIVAVVLAAFTQHDLIVSLAADPNLGYFQSFLKVSIDVLGNGFQLGSSSPELNKVFSGGGAAGMLTTMWMILMAAPFGAVAEYTGMLGRLISPVIKWAKGPVRLILMTMLTSIGLNIATADYNVSIMLTGRMFRKEYINARLKPQVLTTAIADSGNIFSWVIPWNVHGVLLAALLGMSAAEWAPLTFICYITPVVTFVMSLFIFRKQNLPESEDAVEAYGEAITEVPETAQLA